MSKSQPKVFMKQEAKNRWCLKTEKGHILLKDIMLGSELEATKFANNYISSFRNWTVETIPLRRKNGND